MNIKNALIISAFLLTGFNADAQKFFIQPYIGAGTTGVTGGYYNPGNSKNLYQNKFTSTVGINAGRYFGRFQLSVGVGIITTGYKHTDLQSINMSPNAPLIIDGLNIHTFHRHVFGSVAAGYTVVKRKRVSVTPIMSVAPSYVAKSKSEWQYASSNKPSFEHTYKGNGNPYPTLSFLGIAAVECAWNINSNIAITFSPSFYYTLNPMMQNAGGNERNYAITGNAGVLLRL